MIATSRLDTGTTMATIRHQAAGDGLHPVDDRLRAVLDAMPTLVWLAAADGAAVHISQRWLEYTGLSPEQAGGWGWTIPVHHDDINRVTAHWQTLLAAGAQGEIEVRLRRSDGRYRWFRFTAAPLHDHSGRLTGWCGTNVDIDDRRRADEAACDDRKRAEDALRSRERQFQAIVDNIPAMIAIHSESGYLELENRAAQTYHGRLPGQSNQADTHDAVHPDDVDAFVAAIQRALMTGRPLELEQRLRGGDGVYRWFHVRSFRSSDDEDGGGRWYTVGTDIHDRKTAEETARAAERDLRLVLDTVPALVKTMTPTGEIDFANRRLLDYLGVSLEQLQDWPQFVHESDRPMIIDRLKQSLDSGEPYEAECRLRRADGVYRWFHGSAVPVRAQDGTLVRWYYLITDIEDRKQAEDLLRSSERQFHAIVDNIPALVGVITETGELEIVNKASLDYHGLTLEELRRWKVNDLVHPEDLPAELAALTRSFETGQPLEHEHRLRRADGEYRWFQLRALRSCDEWNSSPRWYCVEIDIHDRKLAEQALLESEARLLEVQQLSRTGAWRFDPAAGIVESSLEIQRVYGVQPGEDISQPRFWFDRIHPEDRPRVQTQFERCLNEKTEYRASYRIVLPDGSVRYQYATGHPVTNDAGNLLEFIGASMDMTEHWLAATKRSLAEEALRESERKSRLVVDSIPGLVALLTADGEVEFVNRQILEYTGRTLQELKQWSMSDTVHPDDLPRITSVFTQSIASGSPYEIEERIRRSDGVYRWFQNRGSPLRDTSGRIVGWCVLLTDIDERKRAEDALHRMQTRLSRATQVAAVGEMTGSIAHEVNQPLAAVVANGHACLRWLSASPPNVTKAIEAAERIVKDGKDAGEVVRRVRALFKRTVLEKVSLDLGEVIAEVGRLLDSYPARRHVSLDVALDPA